MSYEPRSRGMRPRRVATKKPPSKDRRETEENKFAYQETVAVNPQEVSARAMNALDHLGNQRFGMPPFSEHFRRWMVDLQSVLDDFRSTMPAVRDEDFASVEEAMTTVRDELNARITAEQTLSSKVSEMLKQQTNNERELATLESEQRTKVHEAKRVTEKSLKRLQGEIDDLDEQRLRLLRQKPKFLERLFGGNKNKVEDSSRSLHSKEKDLKSSEASLKKRIDALRLDYQNRKRPLTEQQAELRERLTELRSTTMDDALEIRKAACQQMRRTISTALSQPAPTTDEGKEQ